MNIPMNKLLTDFFNKSRFTHPLPFHYLISVISIVYIYINIVKQKIELFYYTVKKEHDTYQTETYCLSNHRRRKKLYKNTGSQMNFSGKQNTGHTDKTNTPGYNSGKQNTGHTDKTNTPGYNSGKQNTGHTDKTNILCYNSEKTKHLNHG